MIMINLFSIFDPSAWVFNLNWLSLTLIFFMVSSSIWIISRNKSTLKFFVFSKLTSEINLLLNIKNIGKSLFFVNVILIIIANNFLGLYPYIFTYTSHISITLALALPAWLASLIYGWKSNPNNILAHLIPPSTSAPLIPFMVIIESVSIIIRPVTLAIRLATNIIAGHLLLVLLRNQTYLNFSSFLKTLVVSVQFLLLSLELGVALVQSYVFSTLSLLYASESN